MRNVPRLVFSSLVPIWFLALTASAQVARQEDPSTMEDHCRQQVVELHRFFQDWFNAELPPSDEAFARFDRALAEDFQIIGPEGHLVSRERVLGAVRDGHGGRREGGFAIEVKNIVSRTVGEGMVLVTYEEHQTHDGTHRGWLSSALFRADESRPGGVAWVHVHETYLPDDHDG